jgi:hypothetical protein
VESVVTSPLPTSSARAALTAVRISGSDNFTRGEYHEDDEELKRKKEKWQKPDIRSFLALRATF